MTIKNLPLPATLALALVASTFVSIAPAEAGSTVRLQCSADGARDFSMSARFEIRDGNRKKFNASFESAPGLGFTVGQKLPVSVGGVAVGAMTLRQGVGDVIGDLSFDTALRNFPANFPPNVARATSVTVGALGCALN